MNICLRPVEAQDLEKIRTHRNEPLTQRWLERQTTIDAASQGRWFEAGGAQSFRIVCRGAEDIGLARLTLSDGAQLCTVGLDLFSAFRGQGLATPVFQHIVAQGRQLAPALDLWVFLDNHYAVRTYLKSGFVHDHSTPVKFFTREIDGQLGVHAYVRMVYQAAT
jgi:GNAT superfamily N-acetyltransferase